MQPYHRHSPKFVEPATLTALRALLALPPGRLRISYCFEPSVFSSLRAFHLDSIFDGSSTTGKRVLNGLRSVLARELVG